MGAVTDFIQSSISKKEKRMKFAYGLVLGLLTFTQAYTLGGDVRKREANTQYLESYTPGKLESYGPEKLEDPVYSLKRKREAKEGEREDGKLQKYAEKLEAAAAKLEDSVYSLKRKREAKEEDKYYYGEGETTTEAEDGKLQTYQKLKDPVYSLKRKREAKEEDKYYYGEGETTTEAEDGKLQTYQKLKDPVYG